MLMLDIKQQNLIMQLSLKQKINQLKKNTHQPYELSYSDIFLTSGNQSSERVTLDQGSWASLGGSDSKESACNVGDLGSIPGLGRSLEKGMATHSSILGEFHGQRSLTGYSP